MTPDSEPGPIGWMLTPAPAGDEPSSLCPVYGLPWLADLADSPTTWKLEGPLPAAGKPAHGPVRLVVMNVAPVEDALRAFRRREAHVVQQT